METKSFEGGKQKKKAFFYYKDVGIYSSVISVRLDCNADGVINMPPL